MPHNILIIDNNSENRSYIKSLCLNETNEYEVIESESDKNLDNIFQKQNISIIFFNTKSISKNIQNFILDIKNNPNTNLIPLIAYGKQISEREKFIIIELGAIDTFEMPINPAYFRARMKSCITMSTIFENFNNQHNAIEHDKNNFFYNERLKISQELSMNLANEIKDQFNYILNTSTTLMKSCHENNIAEKLQKIHQYADSACNILNFMIEQTTLGEPNFQLISISDVVRESISTIRDNLKFNSLCKIRIFDNMYNYKIKIDRLKFQKAFANIIINSYESIFERNDSNFAGTIEINGILKDNHYIILVRDNGVGIQNSAILKLFNPFFSTKNNHKGMGLTYARQVFENSHHGTIKIESELLKGTLVTIELPTNIKEN